MLQHQHTNTYTVYRAQWFKKRFHLTKLNEEGFFYFVKQIKREFQSGGTRPSLEIFSKWTLK